MDWLPNAVTQAVSASVTRIIFSYEAGSRFWNGYSILWAQCKRTIHIRSIVNYYSNFAEIALTLTNNQWHCHLRHKPEMIVCPHKVFPRQIDSSVEFNLCHRPLIAPTSCNITALSAYFSVNFTILKLLSKAVDDKLSMTCK